VTPTDPMTGKAKMARKAETDPRKTEEVVEEVLEEGVGEEVEVLLVDMGKRTKHKIY